MLKGNVPRHPFPLPYRSRSIAYTVPAGEAALADFKDIELFIQPDQGNVLAGAPNMQIASRYGGYIAKAVDDDIALTTGLAEGVPVVSFPGGSPNDTEPLHVPGYTLGGDYMLCILFGFDGDATMSAAQTLFAAGLDGTASSLKVFMLNSGLYVRHDSGDTVKSSVFSAGEQYLVMVTYDATADEIKGYVNSTSSLTWTADAATGAAGGDDGLQIGSRWNAGRTKINQALDGKVRAAWAARAPWGQAAYDTVRTDFLTAVAGLYGDITLA